MEARGPAGVEGRRIDGRGCSQLQVKDGNGAFVCMTTEGVEVLVDSTRGVAVG